MSRTSAEGEREATKDAPQPAHNSPSRGLPMLQGAQHIYSVAGESAPRRQLICKVGNAPFYLIVPSTRGSWVQGNLHRILNATQFFKVLLTNAESAHILIFIYVCI